MSFDAVAHTPQNGSILIENPSGVDAFTPGYFSAYSSALIFVSEALVALVSEDAALAVAAVSADVEVLVEPPAFAVLEPESLFCLLSKMLWGS